MSNLNKKVGEMTKENKVLMLSLIVLTGFVLAVAFHYVLGFYLKFDYPYSTFLFNPKIFFGDFTNLLPQIKNFAPYAPPAIWQQYFPLAYILLMPFAFIKNQGVASVIFLSIFLIFWGYWNIKYLKSEKLTLGENFQNIFILSLVSYPFLCCLDRGNFDMIIFIFFALFIFAFQGGKYKTAAILLGIVNAIKPFSVLFLFLFLFEKKYREFFLSVGTSFLLIMGGFMFFKGNVFYQIAIMLESWVFISKSSIMNFTSGMSNSSSLFMALKLIFCNYTKIVTVENLLNIYKYISLFLTGATLFFAFKEKIFWKKISLLTLYMMVVPTLVFDYKLIFLFVPIWLFVNAKEKSKYDVIYIILFALILIPKRFLLVGFIKFLIFSVMVNPIIMLIFMGLIIFEQFSKQDKIGERNE